MILSVIVPTLGYSSGLKSLLTCLEEQTLSKADFEVIIVNNSNQILQAYSSKLDLKVVDEPRNGSYVARNTGVKKAIGEYVFFTDDDCIPEKDWLKNGLDFIIAQKNLDQIFSGDIKLFGAQETLNDFELFSVHFELQQKQYARKSRAATANMFLSKNKFFELGCFNEKFKSGGDFEFCKRAEKVGTYVKFCSSAVVRHPARASWAELMNKSRRKALNMRERSDSLFLRIYFMLKLLLNIFSGTVKILKIKQITFQRKVRLWCFLITYISIQFRVLVMSGKFVIGS